MNQLSNTIEKILVQFDEFINSTPHLHEPKWLKLLRGQALNSFNKDGGFPLTQNEEWKYTSLKPLEEVYFDLMRSYLSNGTAIGLDQSGISPFDGLKSHELVFVNGQYHSGLSSVKPQFPQEAIISNVQSLLQTKPELLRSVLEESKKSIDPLGSLNTAFFNDGAYIYLPAGCIVSDPIHLIFISTQASDPYVSHLKNLIIAEAGSSATIIESYINIALQATDASASAVVNKHLYFNNIVTQLYLGDGAKIEHYKFQNEAKEAFHIATVDVTQGKNSHFTSHSLAFGGRLCRNNIEVNFAAEESECVLNGIYFANKDQLIDHHTTINHSKPRCVSKQFYKGIIDGEARGVFNGKVVVHQDAQGSDAQQQNKNLLLSDDATINTKPQLEIYADDVKCTHGATIGQLDAESIFYLRSRGISENLAKSILTRAFVSDIISKIKLIPMREKIENLILSSFENREIL